MKRLFAIVFIILIMSVVPASADSVKPDSLHGFYGLFEAITEIEITESSAHVAPADANKTLKLLFGDMPFKDETVLNRDLVKYLSEKCSDAKSELPLKYQDAGLTEKEWRRYYAVLCGAGKLYASEGFLNSGDELTYEYFLGSLSLFEKEILKNLNYSALKGKVITVSLENKTTSIRLTNSDGIHDIKIKNFDTQNVFKDGYIVPYSRNIKRDDVITVYTDEKNNAFYVKVTGEYFQNFDGLNILYDLYKGEIYYIDTNTAIVKNVSKFNGYEYSKYAEYSEFVFDTNTVFEYNFNPSEIGYINENLLDKKTYIICDKSKNAKYFNISE